MTELTTQVLRGRVGTEPRVTRTASGKAWMRFRLAVPRVRRKDDGTYEELDARWYTVRVWDRLAEHVEASVRCGEAVIVIGRPTVNAWIDSEGVIQSELVVTAQSIGHDLVHGTSHFTRRSRGPFAEGGAAGVAVLSTAGGATLVKEAAVLASPLVEEEFVGEGPADEVKEE